MKLAPFKLQTFLTRSYQAVPNRTNLEHDEVNQVNIATSLGSKGQEISATSVRWTPLPLSKFSLLSFAALFSSLLIALLVLWVFNERHDGFQLITDNHYTWTYGPTAVLVIVVSLWRQVDYYCKALTPWTELENGPTTAKRSIFLDYVGSAQPVALFYAIRNRHLPVVIAITGMLLLNLITVASTSLLLPRLVPIGPRNISLVQTTVFDASDYRNGSLSDPSLVYIAYAVRAKDFPLAEGTTTDLLYETFQLPTNQPKPNATMHAKVQVFIPKIDCKPVSVSLQSDAEDFDDAGLMGVSVERTLDFTKTASCTTGRSDGNISINNIKATYCRPNQLVPFRSWVRNCTGNEDDDRRDGPSLLLSLFNMHYDQLFNQSMDDFEYGDWAHPYNWSFTATTKSAALCKLSYAIQDANISYIAGPGKRIQIEPSSNSTTIPGFTDLDLSNEFDKSLSVSLFMLGPRAHEYDEQPPELFFNMMTARIQGDYVDLSNVSRLTEAASAVFPGIGVQIGKKYLLKTRDSNIIGQISYEERRLQVQVLPLGMMIAGLASLLFLSITICFKRPTVSATTDLTSMWKISEIQSDSLDYNASIIANMPQGEQVAMKSMSHDHYASSGNNEHTSIIIHKRSYIKPASAAAASSEWWAPFTLTKVFIWASGFLTLLFIAILEVLQHISDRNKGLASLRGSSTFAINAYTGFLPALTMLLINTLYLTFDSNTALLAPLSALMSRPSFSHTLHRSLLSRFPPLALLDTLRYGYWAATATALASTIASALTIIVSGLYTVQNVPHAAPTVVNVVDTWNLNWTDSFVNDNQAAIVSSLIETANLSYPKFTHNELIFPRLQLSPSHNSTWADTSGLIHVRVPALRANLRCDNISLNQLNFTYEDGQQFVRVRMPLPSNCLRGSAFGNESFLNYEASWYARQNSSYLGEFLDLHVGPFQRGQLESGNDIRYGLQQPDNLPGCPSIGIHYGFAETDPSRRLQTTILMCYQEVQAIDTDLTLSVPDLNILPTHPPVPDETSARLVGFGSDNATAYWWRLQSHFDYQFRILNGTNSTAFISPTWDPIAREGKSPFFAGVLYGKTPLAISSLVEPGATTFDHIQSFYRRYMAQTISANMRVSLPPSPNSPVTQPLTADFTPDLGTPRLVQTQASKITLQIMLGLMFILGATAFTLADTRDVVPWNPCTIAGVSVLFGGSKLCDQRKRLDPSNMDNKPEEEFKVKRKPVSAVYEVDLLRNSKNQGRSRNSETDVHDVTAGLIIDEHIPEPGTVTVRPDDQWITAKFRLGWWKDGTYVPTSKTQSRKMVAERIAGKDGWRYGIDV